MEEANILTVPDEDVKLLHKDLVTFTTAKKKTALQPMSASDIKLRPFPLMTEQATLHTNDLLTFKTQEQATNEA